MFRRIGHCCCLPRTLVENRSAFHLRCHRINRLKSLQNSLPFVHPNVLPRNLTIVQLRALGYIHRRGHQSSQLFHRRIYQVNNQFRCRVASQQENLHFNHPTNQIFCLQVTRLKNLQIRLRKFPPISLCVSLRSNLYFFLPLTRHFNLSTSPQFHHRRSHHLNLIDPLRIILRINLLYRL